MAIEEALKMAIEPLRMTRFAGINFLKRGKVRDVYDLTLKGRSWQKYYVNDEEAIKSANREFGSLFDSKEVT